MNFWRIHSPEYENDYKYSYINGGISHPYGMPGIKCDICLQKWGGNRILPFECPPSLRDNKNIKEGWPISREQHQALQSEVIKEFSKIGINCPPLEPGDDFQPCYLDVPSKPCMDFLWAAYKTLVISERIKKLFELMKVQDIVFCPVILHKIGKRSARLPAPIPSTSEPEDLINELPLLEKNNSVGPYYEVIIQSESNYGSGAEPIAVCSGCGRKTFRNNEDRFLMQESMWKGGDIFFLAGTLHVVVTDKLKDALQELRAKNVEFKML
jgi:uncharacterized protein CXXCG